MPESKWSVPTPDGKVIYGVLNKDTKGKNKKAIIHIHGLSGSAYDCTPTIMAHKFPAEGYDIIRPYLYHTNADARSMVESTIRLHAQDTNTVAEHFKTDYQDLFVTGHSYGGPSIMSADTHLFKAICLWDPTYDPSTIFDLQGPMEQIGPYYMLSPTGVCKLMGKDMYEERLIYTKDYSRQLSAKCTSPLQVILAGDRSWALDGESFHSHAAGPNNCLTIPNTVHCFYEEGTTEPLLKYTKDWFDQFATV